MNELRPDLTTLPGRLTKLPVRRGYPVPWFVAMVNGDYDFRVPEPGKREYAVNKHVCWICGQRMGVHMAFVIGPMCAINRISSDPAMHLECAQWSIMNCPFLTKPQMTRREAGLPEDAYQQTGFIARNPGVTLLWNTKSYKPFYTSGTEWLIKVGMPRDWKAYRERREATQEELLDSIKSGLHNLIDECPTPDALKALKNHVAEAEVLLRLPKNILASMIPNAKAGVQSSTVRLDG
jgi:hypothetical protein